MASTEPARAGPAVPGRGDGARLACRGPAPSEQREWFDAASPVATLPRVDLAPINLTLVFMLGALSLNFLTGSAGVISLAHAAFFASRAMAAAVAGGRFGWPFPAALAAASVAGMAVGLIAALPALRGRGAVLLLSTLAVHQIVLYLIPELKLRLFGIADFSYAPPAFGPYAVDTPLRWYYLLLAIVLSRLFRRCATFSPAARV